MNPRHNHEWLCRHSMWDTYATKQGDKCFHCALKEFQARDLKVDIPVRGCWPDECAHNPESDDYRYSMCGSEEFFKLKDIYVEHTTLQGFEFIDFEEKINEK